MKSSARNAEDGHGSVYAELRPIERHRSFIDHLFVLRDHGRLVGGGSNLFASPFSEIAVIGRCPDHDGKHNRHGLVWKALHLPPRFGRTPRQHGLHGWMLGVRCRPLDPGTGNAALAGLAERIAAAVRDNSADILDPIIDALDIWVENIGPRLHFATSPQLPALQPDAEDISSVARRDRGVASLAAAAGVDPRTLQRRFRKRTGLGPKQYAAVERFNAALRQLALGGESLANIASELGYADQSHLTTDLGQKAGMPPGRFRAKVRRQIVRDAVRFFKDTDLQGRVRLLVCDSGATDDEVTDVEIQSQGCEVRGPRASELRTPNRDGDTGH